MKRPHNPRVLMMVENSYFPTDFRTRREANALTRAGYQVSVIAPARKGQPMQEVIDGVHVYRYPISGWGKGFAGYLWEYGYSLVASLVLSVKVLLRERFDVIHAANPPDTFVFIAALYKLLGKRFVFDHHDLAPEMYEARLGSSDQGLVYRTLVLLERLSCGVADRVIATNESYRAMEMKRSGVPADRITIVRNGPDPEVYQDAKPDPSLRRREGEKLIVFAGAMGPQDGVDYLVRAVQHLRNDLGRTDFRCYIVGGAGDARKDLIRLTTELGLDEYVQFTGWVSDSDWVRYLASADICVAPDPLNPFTDRSTMMKVMEYMAAGKPVVAFDLREHRFTAGNAGLFVRPNDELEFARALEALMDDPARREEMGTYGRRRIETNLAWAHSIPSLLDAYARVVGVPDDKAVLRPQGSTAK